MSDKDILADAKEAFQTCIDAESENRKEALDDLEFVKLNKQWPEQVIKQRQAEGRPCLTIPKLPAFIRQVVNDARQNKPQINVRPVDDSADVETADIINGIIRNIEQTSNADVAYDTASDFAVSCGIGYFRIDVDFAHDMSMEKELRIKRVSNPFIVYGDPHSLEADSSDWNLAFITEPMSLDVFNRRYKGAEPVKWDDDGYNKLDSNWVEDKAIIVAEYWTRDEYDCPIVALSNGMVVEASVYEAQAEIFAAIGVTVVGERTTKRMKTRQRLMTGAEVLSDNEWAGQYIPVVPVYGEEINIEGKRIFKSLIRDAKDAQRMVNYWRSAATEMVALAPKAPYIGPKGAFDSDRARWDTANSRTHAFLEYDPVNGQVPTRQQFANPAIAEMQEALAASDDIKAITGMYDASLGQKSNETSGKAIMARQREGDISTFHFVDNLSRAIRHGGRILIDMIPLVYGDARIVRTLGAEGDVGRAVVGGQSDPRAQQMAMAQKASRIYDLGVGRYDLAVEAGPSFTTRRQEAAEQMIELIRAVPDAAPLIGDLLVKNLDWPGAEEISTRLKALLPAQFQQDQDTSSFPPEAQQMIAQLQGQLSQMGQAIGQLQQQAQGHAVKAQADLQTTQMETTSKEKIAVEQIASDERIALAKLNLDAQQKDQQRQADAIGATRQQAHDIRMARMVGQAGNSDQPVPGDPFTEIASGLEALGQSILAGQSQIAEGQRALAGQVNEATGAIISAVTAPKMLVTDEQGRPMGVRVVTH